jgi:hypothetical protein
MFPGDLLAKLTQEGIKAIAKHLASRSVDSRKAFGRDLLRFHEAIREYKYHAEELYRILTRPGIADMRKNSMDFHNLLDRANHHSEGLTRSLGEMGGVLEPAFRSYNRRISVERAMDRRFTDRARRRSKVLSIYDDGLEELVALAYTQDMRTINFAQALNEIYFSTKYREVWTYIPGESDLDAALAYISDRGGYHAYYHIKRSGTHPSTEPPDGMTRISLDDVAKIEELARLIRISAETVDRLDDGIKQFLRDHFTIDDLL